MTRYHPLKTSIAQARREKSAREWRDIEQKEIADAVGVTVTTYGRWESGEREPRGHLNALAEYFGLTPPELRYRLIESGQPQPNGPDLRDMINETTAKRVSEPSVTRSKRAAAKKGRAGKAKPSKRASDGRA